MVIVIGESAQDKFERLRRERMHEIYDEMLEHQDKIIEDAMKDGKRECAFHFGFERTREQLQVKFADEWFDEFRKCAKEQYEANGYKVVNTTISW